MLVNPVLMFMTLSMVNTRVILPHFLIKLKFYFFFMRNEKPAIRQKSGREISEEFVLNLKKFFSVFLILTLLIGMLLGFIVLYF